MPGADDVSWQESQPSLEASKSQALNPRAEQAMPSSAPETCDVLWPWAYRVIPSRFPPINVFERYYDSGEEMEIAFALESHTNARLLNEVGQLRAVPRDEWVWGVGASWIMAAFTHFGQPSRFSDGAYGVYYTAESVETAIAETRFHRERFMRAARSPSIVLHMRVLRNRVIQPLHDLREDPFKALLQLSLTTYPAPQAFARQLRQARSWGLLYPSVRRPGGECAAIFRPRALSLPTAEKHLEYHWDGDAQRITNVRELP